MAHDTQDPLDTWTLAIDSDGDIRWNNQTNAPVRVEGLTAIKQDLLVALDSYEGEDPLDDEFGLDVFSAVRNTTNLKHEVTETIKYDDYRHSRIESVTNVTVERRAPGSREATVYVEARLDDNQPLTFTFNLFRGTVSVE